MIPRTRTAEAVLYGSRLARQDGVLQSGAKDSTGSRLKKDPGQEHSQEDNGVDARGSLEIRVRIGVVASGHGKQDDQDGDWQVCQALHAAEDSLAPRSFLLQVPVSVAQDHSAEQEALKEKMRRMILDVSGHEYAVLAVDEVGILHGISLGYGWRQAKSRDEVRTGVLHQGNQAVQRAKTGQDPRKGRGENEF